MVTRKEAIYIPIEDVTSTKEDGIQKVTISPGARTYRRGSRDSFVRTGGGRSRTPIKSTSGGVTEVSPGLYRYRDPITGVLFFTSSEEFANTSSISGTPELTQEFQKRFQDPSSPASGSGTPIAFDTEKAARQEIQAKELSRLIAKATTEQSRRQLEARRNQLLFDLAKREQSRIIQERSRLIKLGAKERKIISTDVKTGNKLQVTNWRLKDGTRVQRIKNLTTGDISYKSFAPSRVGGKVYLTRGVTFQQTRNTLEDIQKLQRQLLPGEKLIYNIKTMVIVGIESSKLGQLIPYTERGIKFYNKRMFEISKKFDFKRFLEESAAMAAAGKQSIMGEEKGKFGKGFEKVAISRRFQSKEVRAEQERKEKKWNDIMDKMKKGEKLTQTDISNFRKIVEFTPEKFIDKDVAKFAQISGAVIGTFVAPIPGAIIWAMGDTMESVRKSVGDGKKVSKQEFGKIILDSATKGAIMGFSMKLLGGVTSIAGKRILLTGAMRSAENAAVRAAVNHGGVIIKLIGRSGKNFISTYFMKDMLGNVFEITKELKSGNFNNVLRKAIETGAAIGGYIGGSKIGKATTKGALFVSGRLKPTVPELVTKRTPADVMSKQLLSEGKIVLTRRGVYETGKGMSPRKDAWLDSKIKNPTKSIFWRFDKTLSKKDQAISPLPLFTKSKAGYLKMFRSNWNKNKGMNLVKRYIKTTAETPLVEDVLIRRIVRLKDIKDLKLRRQVIKEYATKGKLSKITQDKVLRNPKFGISDKNREFGFHDENEFVTRTRFKVKGRQDISWTYDPSLREYVPVVESLKTTNRIKNFLSVLNRRKIITRTDAKFILDNYAIKKKFGAASVLPQEHSWQHMKNVEINIVKLMNKYPEFNPYWRRTYGSVAKARDALKQAMWHDIGKGESASMAFGTPHGEKVWRVWKAGLLPKDIKLAKRVAKAIKKHETLDPRKLWYKVQNKVKLITPEEKIVATADRLDLVRLGIKVDPTRLPLKGVLVKLNIKQKDIKFPESFKSIINRIKIDKGVTRSDLKKLSDFLKFKVSAAIKAIGYKTKRYNSYSSLKSKNAYRAGWSAADRAGLKPPSNYNAKYKGNRKAYIEGYKERYDGKYLINYNTGAYKIKLTRRPQKRLTKRATGRLVKRASRRPAKISPRRPPKRPTRSPPTRPPRRPPRRRPPTIPGVLPEGFKRKTISKPQPVFYIKVKRKGRIVNLLPRPLILRDAKDYLAYKLDKNLIRTAYFEPIGRAKNVVRIPPRMRGYFTKVRHKLRPYKIRVGRRRMLRNGFIERKKFVGDTKSELKELQEARKSARRNPVRRKRKLTPSQRKVMLKNLKKARRAKKKR